MGRPGRLQAKCLAGASGWVVVGRLSCGCTLSGWGLVGTIRGGGGLLARMGWEAGDLGGGSGGGSLCSEISAL